MYSAKFVFAVLQNAFTLYFKLISMRVRAACVNQEVIVEIDLKNFFKFS